ncbi:uncharacterized protein EAF01_000305 [Botrytis porri]|uniref:SWR1-complex protein 3 domain-containing protein n=1 Tax=Botrytis porri TaxID=87229 RepID=A0A4Z1L5M4_9HELO|nr:uncharacterized protein EAF01_000305 [Botrytis porri]KAF7913899.1 hypothetical protein EAF01_000305 [Botrytis porri]TGO91966.1 hypothetical protein BPOR_0014g00390 [Botrytis porri]
MERKRKLPARSSRGGEPANKKRTATPPDRSISVTPQPPIEETLPKSIVAGMPLPTVDEPQSDNLSSKDFQTISESGVLAESLQRSRQKWVSEGIFEKYWTKPTKKKGVPAEPLNNPGKDTMTKLGTCQITIEPHVFDATMYAIKEPKSAFQSTQQQQMYRPIIQYGPPNGVMPPLAPIQAPSPAQQKPIQTTQPTVQTMAPNHPAPTAPMILNPLPPAQAPSMGSAPMNGQTPAQGPNNPNTNLSQPISTAQPVQPAQPNKSTDPVIQMLAERAATDQQLKGLMRIVANGEATSSELRQFQNHIDELNAISKARQKSAAQSAAQPPMNANSQSPLPPSTTQLGGPPNAPVAKPAPPPTPAPISAPPQQPQALRSKGPVAPPKPDISGVVLEFNGGNGDRYLFPKYSILDYLPGGQVIASFLIVRKGSSSDSTSYDPELDYYQPVTIRLYTHQGKQLDSLQKVVASPDEVRRYMEDIMDNTTRAEYVLLAMRLPKDTEPEKEGTPANSSDQPESDANNANLPLWQTTNGPPPPPVTKLPRKILTEEEKYESFIKAVGRTL